MSKKVSEKQRQMIIGKKVNELIKEGKSREEAIATVARNLTGGLYNDLILLIKKRDTSDLFNKKED